METITRRDLLVTLGVAAGATPGLSSARAGEGEAAPKLRIIVAGGHPDDPMSGCGGTMARLADLGHDVVAVCLTRGEAGIQGKSHEEAGAIRSEEALRSCKILKARLRFAGQVDRETEVNSARYDEFQKVLEEEKPDAVFTHWPTS